MAAAAHGDEVVLVRLVAHPQAVFVRKTVSR
jgi:hypothetical protein